MLPDLNDRQLDIFRFVVDNYLQTGSAVGARTISDGGKVSLSPASIRAVLADLENEGFLYAPHTSAGRMPTDIGLRYYIDGLLEIGNLTKEEQKSLEEACKQDETSYRELYEQAGTALYGLSQTTSLVVAPTKDKPLKQIQFVRLEADKALVVLVHQDGSVSNRLMSLSPDLPDSALMRASNFLNEHVRGKTLSGVKTYLAAEIQKHKHSIDRLTQSLIDAGLAAPASGSKSGFIVVRGQSTLLNNLENSTRLEEVSDLFAMLEEQETISKLLDTTRDADGVQIFVGTENKVFARSGWSMILSPYKSNDGNIVGALGVIGPTRLNYGRIIPMVDYTARIMEKLLRHK